MSVTGWLIERADSSPPWPWYWAAWRETSARRSAWTQNPEQAIRFARREDAERTQRRLFKDIRVRVCEHAWDAPALTPSTGTREDELREALTNARSMLITLAGDPRKFIAEDRGGMGDKTQAALLDQLDNALARITEGTPKP